MKKTGARDLSLIRQSGSTTRVLNLCLTHERHGESEDYAAAPLFRNKRLNKALVLKHTLRANERHVFKNGRQVATKVIIPFALNDLRLGGSSFLVGQDNYERMMRETVGGYATTDDFAHDVSVLRQIDDLPSLDPFLLRERLRRSGIEVARCYFDVSEADMTRMRAFVGGEILKLVQLAFAGEGPTAMEMARKLADKLLADESSEGLEPLRLTLHLSPTQYREGFFAWKGFLYYKWTVLELGERLKSLSKQILTVRFLRATDEDKAQLNTLRQRIVDLLGKKVAEIHAALATYDRAFNDLVAKGNPLAFREFLLKAPAMFLVIGQLVGVIQHINAFWGFRFPMGSPLMMEADEAFELLSEFEVSLGGAVDVKPTTMAAW